MSIKLLICEDQMETIADLEKRLFEQYGNQMMIHSFQTAFSMLDYIQTEEGGSVDIVLMDIKLREESGIETAKLLQREYPSIKVIFITAYIDYAKDIFDANPIHFIVKPIENEKLFAAVDKALAMVWEEKGRTLEVSFRGKISRIEMAGIDYVESDKRSVCIHEKSRSLLTIRKLGELEKELPEEFMRCHQSYIVNMNRIKEFSTDGIELYSGVRIPVSRNRYKNAREKFLRYMGDKL